MKYLLDTDICIFLIRKKPESLISKLQSLSFGAVAISSITLAELQVGVNKSSNPSKNATALIYFLLALDIIDFDYNAAVEYGHIRTNLENKGLPIGPMDTLIAAHAKSLNIILVTNNTKEFKRVKGLKIENWIE